MYNIKTKNKILCVLESEKNNIKIKKVFFLRANSEEKSKRIISNYYFNVCARCV